MKTGRIGRGEAEAEVTHEEVLVHSSTATRRANGWRMEARVIAYVTIDGRPYEANQIVQLRLRRTKAGSKMAAG